MDLPAIQALVSERRGIDSSVFVLLDPLAELQEDNPLQLEALSLQLGEEAVLKMLRPDLAHTPALCPALVTIAAPGAQPSLELLKVLADQVRREANQEKRYVCGLLTSYADAQEITAHVLSQSHLPAGQDSIYLPVHEPLRLELLNASLDAHEQEYWWPIEHWLYPDSNGAFQLISAKPGVSKTANPFAASIQKDTALVSALLGIWRRTPPFTRPYAPYANSPISLPDNAAVRAYTQIQLARQRGLIRHEDLLLLAVLQLTVHPQLQRHPKVSGLIDTVISRQTPLADLIQPYRDEDWERIVSDLGQAGAYP